MAALSVIRRVRSLGIPAVLVLFAAIGCPWPLEGGWVRLQIDTTAESRGIAVADFVVASLRIELQEP